MFFPLKRLFSWSFPFALTAAYVWSGVGVTAAPQSPIGSIEAVQGYGWGISELGKKYDKLGGDRVVLDEVVATGIDSSMTLRFIDTTIMTLGPSAEMTLDDMVYNPEDGKNDTVTFKLGKGTFYFVSGLVAKDRVSIVTPTATIGIRGTELVINVGADGATSVGVASGRAIMRSTKDGRSVDVEVGSTARTDEKGQVSDPFPGIDLTGEEEVDRHIPGVSEWLDEQKEDKEDEKDIAKLSDANFNGDDERGDEKGDKKGDEGKDGEDGGDRKSGGNDDDGGEGGGHSDGGDGNDGGDGDGGDGNDGGDGGDGGGDGGDGGGDGGDGGDGGGDGGDGSDGGDGDGGGEHSRDGGREGRDSHH